MKTIVLNVVTLASSVALVTASPSASAEGMKYYTASMSEGAPTVDGSIDDPVWKGVPWGGSYVLAKKAGEPTEQTRFKAVYTKDALYVAVESLDSEVEKIHPEFNDAEWWYVDISELFLGTSEGEVLHLIYTARGHRYEEIPGAVQLRTKNAVTWSAASQIGKGNWTCEFKVPLELLGVDPGDRYMTVPFNLCRCISRKREFSSWNFSPTTFTSSAGFGRLAFGGRAYAKPVFTGSELSFSCWAKVPELASKDAPRGRTSYAFISWSGFFRLMLSCDGSLESEFDGSKDGKSYQFITSANVNQFFEKGEWMHLAASYSLKDGATALYLNGQHVGSRKDDLRHQTALVPLQGPRENAPFNVGSLPGGYFPVDGEIAGVRFYDHAVTAEELSKFEEPVWKKLEPEAKNLADLQNARRARRAEEADRLFKKGRMLRYSIVDVLGRELFKWDTPLKEETLDLPMKIVSAKGEYEAAGFIVRSKNAVQGFLPVASDLRDGQGNVLPASTIDLRINKVMARNVSPYSKIRILEPTVLVHDDRLLSVDEGKMENLMRYDFPEGSKYVNVSEPRSFKGGQSAVLKVEEHPIHDAKTLQPVDLKDHRTIEYWATSFVPLDTKPGLYKGEIALKTVSGESFGVVPVELTVLPFALPDPKTRYNPKLVYERGIYHRVGDRFDARPDSKGTIGQRGRNEQQIRAEFRNMAAHGIQHPCVCMELPMPYWKGDPSCYNPKNGGTVTVPDADGVAYFKKYIAMMNEEGLCTNPLYVFNHGNLGFRDHYDRKTMKGQLEEVIRLLNAYLMENLGHTNVLYYGVDEAHGDELVREFNFWEDAGKLGLRFYTTTLHQNIPLLAGRIHLASVSHAMDKKSAKDLHDAGTFVWSYGNPQSNLLSKPFPYRVNFGLGEWLSNWDGYGVYAYNESSHHPWNCWDGGEYSYVFQTADGVCDLPNWEGQREAYDDVRYATLLRSFDDPADEKFFDSLDPTHPAYDPNVARAEMIRRILKHLQK